MRRLAKYKCAKMCGWVRGQEGIMVARNFHGVGVVCGFLLTICMYCDGCDTKALNCKPNTNLKEKSELSKLLQTSS